MALYPKKKPFFTSLLLTLGYGVCCSNSLVSSAYGADSSRFYPGYQLTTGPDPRCLYEERRAIEYITIDGGSDMRPVPEPFTAGFIPSEGIVLEVEFLGGSDYARAWIEIPDITLSEILSDVVQTSGYLYKSGHSRIMWIRLEFVDVRLLEVSEQEIVAAVYFSIWHTMRFHFVGTFELATPEDFHLCQEPHNVHSVR